MKGVNDLGMSVQTEYTLRTNALTWHFVQLYLFVLSFAAQDQVYRLALVHHPFLGNWPSFPYRIWSDGCPVIVCQFMSLNTPTQPDNHTRIKFVC